MTTSKSFGNVAKLRGFVDLNDPVWGTDNTGSADSTTGIQAACDTGLPVYGSGIFKTTSTLNLTAAAHHGLVINGGGAQSSSGTGTNKLVIRPTSAVSQVFKTDGSGISLAIQNGSIRNLTVDMANMTDATTSIAFRQLSAYGWTYDNVNVINDGSNKRGWKFEAGAYTTTLINCKAKVFELLGTNLSDATTTLNFIGCDFEQIKAQYAIAINVVGGAVQGSRNKFDLADINGISIVGLDVEGTGTYLVIGSNVSHLHSFANEFSGFSGTYSSGTPADSALFDYQGGVYQLYDSDFKVSGGILSVIKANAALLRCLIENTNASAQQVDTEYKNSAGSGYVGVTSGGKTFVDGRAGAGAFLQVGGTDVVGADVNGKFYVFNNTAATATNGTGEAMPANVEGYLIINIGGTDRKIPFVKT